MADETYVGGLRDLLGEFRPRALLILDEAHHAAPASGSRYAVDSQFTRAIRGLAERFRAPAVPVGDAAQRPLQLVLRAAGDPRSAALHRGVPVKPRELDPVMVRRLKSDLRYFGEKFPERRVEAIVIQDLPSDAPELAAVPKAPELWRGVAGQAGEHRRPRGWARSAVVCRPAAAPAVVDRRLRQDAGGASQGPRQGERQPRRPAVAEAFVRGGAEPEDEPDDPADGASSLSRRRRRRPPRRPARWPRASTDLALVDEMLAIARQATPRTPTRASGCSRRGYDAT